MVHNGIEYGDMQLVCEAYNLMKDTLGMSHDGKFSFDYLFIFMPFSLLFGCFGHFLSTLNIAEKKTEIRERISSNL